MEGSLWGCYGTFQRGRPCTSAAGPVQSSAEAALFHLSWGILCMRCLLLRLVDLKYRAERHIYKSTLSSFPKVDVPACVGTYLCCTRPTLTSLEFMVGIDGDRVLGWRTFIYTLYVICIVSLLGSKCSLFSIHIIVDTCWISMLGFLQSAMYFFKNLCIYLLCCVCVCVFMCTHVFVYRCMFMCVHVEPRSWWQVSFSITLYLVLWGKVSHWTCSPAILQE